MAKSVSRRNFLRTTPLAAAAVTVPLTEQFLFAAQGSVPSAPVPFQLFTAAQLAQDAARLQATPGNDNLFQPPSLPLTVVLTTEGKNRAREFEFHEGRDHVVQIVEGTTLYEVGGTPQGAHSTGPGEWHAPGSAGATTYTLHKGDMLIIPRGTPHKRATATSVTFLLISTPGVVKA
jgi:mannose-6-phosphate isomerase-like protein (cupin superfamily)